MTAVVIELVCGRCDRWLVRYTADVHRPFDEQIPFLREVVALGVVATEGVGGYRQASDGEWYRWAPGDSAALPDGDTYGRYRLTCPSGCSSDEQFRASKFERAAERLMRRLHETRRAQLLRITARKLLEFAL